MKLSARYIGGAQFYYDFEVQITNSCDTEVLTIDPLILSSTTINYQIGYLSPNGQQETLSTSFVSSTDISGLCPGFLLSVWTDDTPTHAMLSSVVIAELGSVQAANNDFAILTTDLATEGSYSLYLEARYAGFYDWQDLTYNGRLPFTVNLINPCKLATLTINPNIFTGGVASFQYNVQTPSSPFSQFLEPNPESFVTSSEVTAACPLFAIDVINFDNTPLNSLAMTYSSANSDLIVDCADVAQVGMYSLKVVAKYDDPNYLPEGMQSFQLELIDFCLAPTITATGQMTVPDYYYTGTATFTLTPFTILPAVCAFTYSCTKTYGTLSSCMESSTSPLTFDTTWTGSDFNLIVGELAELAPSTYSHQIDAVGGTNLDIIVSHTFTITLIDPCPASTLALSATDPWSGQSSYQYILRDPSNTWTWSVDLAYNLSTAIDCGLFEVSFYIQSGVDLSLYASYTQGTFSVDYQEVNLGIHLISYQVSYTNYSGTGPTIECSDCFALTIIDPCDPPTSISLNNQIIDQVCIVDFPAITYQIPVFTTDPAWCIISSYIWSVSPIDVYANHSFDTVQAVFTFDEPASLASTPEDLSTTSTTVVAPYYIDYTLGIEAECNGLISQTYPFNLRSQNPCIEVDYNWINIPATILDPVIYKINSDQLLIENIVSWFSVESPLCGGVAITVDILAAQSQWPGVVLYEADVLKVYTSNLGLTGQTVNILIQPTLIDYPTLSFHTPTETFDQTSMSVILPVTLEECVVTQITKPALDDVIYYFGDSPIEVEYTDFISDEGPECNYSWTYSIDIQSQNNLNDVIETDFNSKTIKIEADSGEEQIATVVLNGALSNGKTTDSVEFLVTLKHQIDYSEGALSDIEVGSSEDTEDEEAIEDTQEDDGRTDEEAEIDQQVHDYRTANLALEEERNNSDFEALYEPPIPYLNGIEQSGTIVVSFSQRMRIIPDLAMITNGTVIIDGQRQPVFDVEIIPSLDSDNSKLTFEWNILEMTERTISIQIYFQSAVYVSSNYEPDILRLSFVDKYMFTGTNYLPIDLKSSMQFSQRRDLRIKSMNYQEYDYDSDEPQIITLERELPAQLQYDEDRETVVGAIQTVSDSSKAVLIMSFALNVLISASLNQVWSLINTQQLIVLMSLFKTRIPANAGIFFTRVMEIAAFDIIETGDTLDEWLELDPIEPDNPNFVTLGLGSIFLLNNMGTLALAYCFWFTNTSLALLIKFGEKKSKYLKNMYRRLERKLFFNSILQLFLESYALIAVCCLINLSYISFATYGFALHSVICIFFSLLLIFLPLFVFMFLRQNFDDLRTRYMKEKFGSLYDGLKLKEGQKVLFEPIYFLFRRLLLALLVVVIDQALIWQIFLMSAQIVSSVILIGHVHPYQEKNRYRMEIYNEITLMFVMYTIICFSPFIPDAEVRYFIGYICIFIVCLHLAVNLIEIIRTTQYNLRHALKVKSAIRAYLMQRQRQQKRLAKNHDNRHRYLKRNRARMDREQQLDSSEDERFEDELIPSQIHSDDNSESENEQDSVKVVKALSKKVHPHQEEEMGLTGILATKQFNFELRLDERRDIDLNFKGKAKKKQKQEKFNQFISGLDDAKSNFDRARDENLQDIEQQTHDLLVKLRVRQDTDEPSGMKFSSNQISMRSSNVKKSATHSSLDLDFQFSSNTPTPWVSSRQPSDMTGQTVNTGTKMISRPNVVDELDEQLMLFEMQEAQNNQMELFLRPKKDQGIKRKVKANVAIKEMNCDDRQPEKKKQANTALWKKSKSMKL